MGLLVGVAVFLVYVSARAGGWDHFSSTDLWLAAAVLFISTSAGKLLGLYIAKRELRRAVGEIRASWARQMARLPSDHRGLRDRGPPPGSFSSTCCGNLQTFIDQRIREPQHMTAPSSPRQDFLSEGGVS